MHEVSNIFTKDKTISSLEVAEMMEIEHKEILKKTGRNYKTRWDGKASWNNPNIN